MSVIGLKQVDFVKRLKEISMFFESRDKVHQTMRRLIKRLNMIPMYGNYLLKRKFYPWSYPLYLLVRLGWCMVIKWPFRSVQKIRSLLVGAR